jgi:hypothetical protein
VLSFSLQQAATAAPRSLVLSTRIPLPTVVHEDAAECLVCGELIVVGA